MTLTKIKTFLILFCIVASLIGAIVPISPVQAQASEDYTTYTEVDIGANRITFDGTDSIEHVGYRNEVTYLYKDFGADYFGDFVHHLDWKPEFNQQYGLSLIWALADDLDDFYSLRTGNKIAIGLASYWDNIYGYPERNILMAMETDGAGGMAQDRIYFLVPNTQYYLRIEKSGTSWITDVWTNSDDRDDDDTGAGSYIGDTTITLDADHEFRYIYACQSYDTTTNYYHRNHLDNLILDTTETPIYVTYYHSSGGVLNVTTSRTYTVNPAIMNGSSIAYTNSTNPYVWLFGCPNNSTSWVEFDINGTSTVHTNPYNLSIAVAGNFTVWANFEAGGDSTYFYLFALFFILFLCAVAYYFLK